MVWRKKWWGMALQLFFSYKQLVAELLTGRSRQLVREPLPFTRLFEDGSCILLQFDCAHLDFNTQ